MLFHEKIQFSKSKIRKAENHDLQRWQIENVKICKKCVKELMNYEMKMEYYITKEEIKELFIRKILTTEKQVRQFIQ